MSLLTRLSIPPPTEAEAEAEDIFSAALTTIFRDDAINSWGFPGATISYHSPRCGPINLRVPIHPDEEQGRKLFAHYLWNAGVVAADLIEVASNNASSWGGPVGLADYGTEYWNIRGQRVLEIGAATALPSMIAALCNAASVTITDHPSSPALTAGGIEQNVKTNLFTSSNHPRTHTPIFIHGYTWGTALFYDPSTYGRPVPPPDPAALPPFTEFTTKGYPRPHKIIIADCLWMPSQHANILQTILDFLAEHPPSPPSAAYSSPQATNTDTTPNPITSNPTTTIPAALVTAGFHTGRAIVRDFFALATGRSCTTTTSLTSPTTTPPPQSTPPSAETAPSSFPGTYDALGDSVTGTSTSNRLRLAHIYETDLQGATRPWTWASVREGEGKWEAKRWCVVGVLVRAPSL